MSKAFTKEDDDGVAPEEPLPPRSTTPQPVTPEGLAHLRAEHAAAGTWIDLHLSLTSDDDVDALRARLLDFLKQISVAADTP